MLAYLEFDRRHSPHELKYSIEQGAVLGKVQLDVIHRKDEDQLAIHRPNPTCTLIPTERLICLLCMAPVRYCNYSSIVWPNKLGLAYTKL